MMEETFASDFQLGLSSDAPVSIEAFLLDAPIEISLNTLNQKLDHLILLAEEILCLEREKQSPK